MDAQPAQLSRVAPGHVFARPTKRIFEGGDVARFLASRAYREIGVFVLQLSHALCPRGDAKEVTMYTLESPPRSADAPSVQRVRVLLEALEVMVAEVPPVPGPRRFGNAAFRTWHGLLGERAGRLLGECLEGGLVEAREELLAYLVGGFGSAQRLDYGTGHELSFLAFIGGLWRLGVFDDGDAGPDGEAVERTVVFGILEPYLRVVRKLITTYTLEPAGSHGVWGLDDHFFLPYIFGSAQLTRPIALAYRSPTPMPQAGTAPRAPKPADILKESVVEAQRPLNLYFSAIGFINDVKSGPFWEHSPILYDISGIRDGWGKINKGMIKMYDAEVLSKFPVVQHFPFGSLFSWDQDPDAAAFTPSPLPTRLPATAYSSTAAPFVASSQTPGAARHDFGASTTSMLAPGSSNFSRPWGRVPPVPAYGAGRVPHAPGEAAQDAPTKAPWAK